MKKTKQKNATVPTIGKSSFSLRPFTWWLAAPGAGCLLGSVIVTGETQWQAGAHWAASRRQCMRDADGPSGQRPLVNVARYPSVNTSATGGGRFKSPARSAGVIHGPRGGRPSAPGPSVCKCQLRRGKREEKKGQNEKQRDACHFNQGTLSGSVRCWPPIFHFVKHTHTRWLASFSRRTLETPAV